jgi:membrane protein DedA with SNARE-associated domain
MSGVLHGLLTAPPALVYVLVGLLVFGEAAVFAGFVLPGETAVVLGGVIASRHGVDLRVLLALVVVSAIIGDSVGYEVGRHWGERVLRVRPLRRHEDRLDRARAFLRERGAFAVFLGRWTAFLRAVMPGLAGVSRMPYRRFLLWNAIGGIVWGVTFCLVGYLAGNSYEVVERQIGLWGAVATVLVVVGLVVVLHVRRRRAEARAGAGPLGGAGPDGDPGPARSAEGQPDGVADDQQVTGEARGHT